MTIPIIVVALLAAWLLYLVVRAWTLRRRALERIADRMAERDTLPAIGDPVFAGWLEGWLSRAGYRSPNAKTAFFVGCIGALMAGLVAAFVANQTVTPWMIENVATIPAGVGEVLAAVSSTGPWLLLAIIGLVPVLAVRAARRNRVRDIEHDLPLVLELFATLAEAGLGFDSALMRIIQVQPAARPLTSELAGFQRDVRAGVPRIPALRQLARRVEVPSLTSLIAAIVQAEQVGGSIAETLRHQADDLRGRRREQALLLAQSLPVKLVVPLVLCFLPGIFLSTLGPVLYQMIEVANNVLRPLGQ
jgi:pilus assembly protein TadC